MSSFFSWCTHTHTLTHTHTHSQSVTFVQIIISTFVLFPVLFKWKCLALLREFYGVGLDVQNKRINQTPVHLAAMANQTECISWMVQNCGFSPGMQVGLTLPMDLNVSDTVCFVFCLSGLCGPFSWIVCKRFGSTGQVTLNCLRNGTVVQGKRPPTLLHREVTHNACSGSYTCGTVLVMAVSYTHLTLPTTVPV